MYETGTMVNLAINFHNRRPYGGVDFVVRESALTIVFAFPVSHSATENLEVKVLLLQNERKRV